MTREQETNFAQRIEGIEVIGASRTPAFHGPDSTMTILQERPRVPAICGQNFHLWVKAFRGPPGLVEHERYPLSPVRRHMPAQPTEDPMTASRLSKAVAALSAAAVLFSTLFAVPAAAAQDPAIDSRPVAPPSTALQAVPAEASGRFIVKFKPGAPGDASARAKAYGQAARSAGVSVEELRAAARGATVVQATETLTPGESAGVLASLRGEANVEYAEQDTFLRPAAAPNDPQYPKQWDLHEDRAGMRVPAAWDLTSGLGAIVAVIDTGITQHNDLAGVLPGYDFISESIMSNDGDGRDADATDAGDYCNGEYSSWHGTHVAGTIGAAANNGEGVAGIAPSSKILPIRALGACGGYMSDIADAVVWAAGGAVSGVPASNYRPQVINMSLGGAGQCGYYLQSALDFAAEQGVAVVAAAGNEDSPASGATPANCNQVITVGATGREGNRAPYSNYGPEVDVAAPGGDSSTGGANTILSTLNTGTTVPGSATYGYMQGTSMAAPHIAGLAALIVAASPNLTPAQVEDIIKQTARPLPGTCDTGGCGTGLADAEAAVRAANARLQPPGPDIDRCGYPVHPGRRHRRLSAHRRPRHLDAEHHVQLPVVPERDRHRHRNGQLLHRDRR